MEIYQPKCPCDNQLGVAKADLKYSPDCPDITHEYCVGYEDEELKPPCPCPGKKMPKD